ncbi:GDP-D-glucose phosphorylase 1 [Bufo gargarizans]|uniref:GDP-D-glucose phosphorylase 1 n=1 Tax=Bufo gargarizans TaxID=30331 RepID=UPI001CF3A420|nr:GDP-D-glucose phosphorylase 1 [Bufo gargarizans]XP_044139165.1 GDP-D-glucose phosphorylase 1 [Bufo gargarizans]XP_044139166.1 GDP-D-glucose phosphorylase 1 [Bufo gargarizans]
MDVGDGSMALTHSASFNGATVEEYRYAEEDFILPGITWQRRRKCAEEKSFISDFDRALQSKWIEKMEQGLFRYPLWSLQTKILPGTVKYVAQLNVKRGIERRKPQDIASIQEKFNTSQFNFNKIKHEEILFKMVRLPPEEVPSGALTDRNPNHVSALSSSRHNHTLVVINVSPLEFGHVLFIPDPFLCLTQILTPDLTLLGLESILLSGHPGFRVGFNSLGGFASVNHLHLHGFYLDEELQIESAESKPLCPDINFHQLTHFPAPGFIFHTDGKDLMSVSQNICRVTDYFVSQNIAHNVFMTRGCNPESRGCLESREGIRVVIWARQSCFGAKEESAFNVALCELAGHLPVKNEDDFNSLTEESVISIVKSYLFSDDEFNKLSLELVQHLNGE